MNKSQEAFDILNQHKIDLILLDIMMPQINGFDACVKFRQQTKAPIIFMSAKGQDMDKIQGLTLGADDYVVKPFNPIELVTRVKAQLRRYHQYNNPQESSLIYYKDLSLNKETRQAWLCGNELQLTQKEFNILVLLLVNKGIVLSSSQIYEKVWREEFLVNDNTVLMHISNLRGKLERKKGEQEYIKTVYGVGYKI